MFGYLDQYFTNDIFFPKEVSKKRTFKVSVWRAPSVIPRWDKKEDYEGR